MRFRFIRLWLIFILPLTATAQIDPVRRDLIQLGYNQPLEGQSSLAGYAYYYHNQPDFLRTNRTLRLAVAPVYLDSNLGFVHGLGPQTDFSLGLAGGGFAYGHSEISGGRYYENQSFIGHGGEFSGNIYHLFNPDDLIPLSLVLQGGARYTVYDRYDTTADNFQLPGDGATFSLRTGLRWGGIEPTLFPALAMEISGWYEGQFRVNSGDYGFGGDRRLRTDAHLFWTAAALSYTLPESQQNFFARLTAGTSVNADRLSAFRLGGCLPLAAEYPLTLPGYYYQEFSARQFALFNASYLLPIAPAQRWNLNFSVGTAYIDYLPGTGQPGNSVTGVGGGILYRAPSDRFHCLLNYGYGVNARRNSGRGANSIGLLVQIDLGKTLSHDDDFQPTQPGRWRGWEWLMGR